MKKLILGSVIGLLVLAIAALVVTGLYLDQIVAKSVEKVGPMLTKVTVKVDGVNLSLFSGAGSINGLLVGNPEGYKTPNAIKVGHATMALSPGSVFSDKIVIHAIKLQAPEITFETDLKGNNLNKILANIEEATGGPSDSSKKLQVDDFLISGAKLNVSLTALGGKSVTVPLPDIHLKNLGQGPEGITAGDLLKQVFVQLESGAVQAAATVAKDIGAQGVEAAREAASTATDTLKKGVGGLLKRK